MRVSAVLIVCPKCNNVIGHDSYFGGFICEKCGYEIKDGITINKDVDEKPSKCKDGNK